MISIRTPLLFIVTALVFSLIPGPAVLQVGAQAFRGGWSAAMPAILGILTGNTVYFLISALGFGALIMASATVFILIKIVGAAYLISLGAYIIWAAGGAEAWASRPGKPYRQALLTQLGNPKAVLFLGAFLPQFLDPRKMLLPQYAEMFVILALIEGGILGLYGWLASRGARLKGPRFDFWRDRISGVIFIAIGAIFAVAQRA